MASPATAFGGRSTAWGMLYILCGAFALSQAYRTLAAILASPLQAEFGLSAQELGIFAAAFHFAFGAMQVFMGVGIDMYGIRRTMLVVFPCAIVGALLSAWAEGYATLVLGQVLIGTGCAPAFLVCTVFIARHFPVERFAAVSGAVLGIGGLGMIFTGTPLAWLVEATSWRLGFLALAAMSLCAWLAVCWRMREPDGGGAAGAVTVWAALRGFLGLLRLPHTWAIVLLSGLIYAAVMSLRGLWLGPLLQDRYDYSLVQSGHVALLISVVMLFSSPVFGRFDPGDERRRRWIIGCTLLLAALFAALAVLWQASWAVVVAVLIGGLSGFVVLQYADVRIAYPAALTGRAMGVFTMAMFLGIALMQWVTGAAATVAAAWGWEAYGVVFGVIATMLIAGAAAFAWLPSPPSQEDGGDA